jgi:hypothetical protein
MRQQRIEPAAVEAEIAGLRSLALDALRRRWREVSLPKIISARIDDVGRTELARQ